MHSANDTPSLERSFLFVAIRENELENKMNVTNINCQSEINARIAAPIFQLFLFLLRDARKFKSDPSFLLWRQREITHSNSAKNIFVSIFISCQRKETNWEKNLTLLKELFAVNDEKVKLLLP